MEISSIQGPALADALLGDNGLVSVADRAQNAFAQAHVQVAAERNMLLAASQDPVIASNPSALAALQVRMAEHTLKVNMAATLVHHVTDGVETLLKS